ASTARPHPPPPPGGARRGEDKRTSQLKKPLNLKITSSAATAAIITSRPTPNASGELILLIRKAKFIPKKPVRKVSGRKMLATKVSWPTLVFNRADVEER